MGQLVYVSCLIFEIRKKVSATSRPAGSASGGDRATDSGNFFVPDSFQTHIKHQLYCQIKLCVFNFVKTLFFAVVWPENLDFGRFSDRNMTK